MLSLVGISGPAFVMMSCKPPPVVPVRQAMGKDLLRADTTQDATGVSALQEHHLALLQPQADESATKGRLPLGKYGGHTHAAHLSFWPMQRPRQALMLAHAGSTGTPTLTATALALAIMLSFAPMCDATVTAGVSGDCYAPSGLSQATTKPCSGIASAEVLKQHVSSDGPAVDPRTSKRPANAGGGPAVQKKARPSYTLYDIASMETRIAALEERLDSTDARAENQEVVILYLAFGSVFLLVVDYPLAPTLLAFLFLVGGSPGWAQFCLGVAELPLELVQNWPYGTM